MDRRYAEAFASRCPLFNLLFHGMIKHVGEEDANVRVLGDRGYRALAIHSPREVTTYGKGEREGSDQGG